ncbi:hypothetical protein E4U54_004538 [Claviceps lovelessii]|nr:hypothetical protein E4U54_004538 [Claviceps lovelessii]
MPHFNQLRVLQQLAGSPRPSAQAFATFIHDISRIASVITAAKLDQGDKNPKAAHRVQALLDNCVVHETRELRGLRGQVRGHVVKERPEICRTMRHEKFKLDD